MRQYKMQETKEIEKIICNKCGKEIIVKNGMTEEDVLEHLENVRGIVEGYSVFFE